MTADRLAQIFEAVEQQLIPVTAAMAGRPMGDIRLKVLRDLMFEFHRGGNIVNPANPDPSEDEIALAICALGPIGFGPPDLDRFADIATCVNLPALEAHNQTADELLQEIHHLEPGAQLGADAKDFQEHAGCWENPAIHGVVWWGLAGNGRVPAAGWLDLWLAAKWWLVQQAESACRYFDAALLAWNHANLQGAMGVGGLAPMAAGELVETMVRQATPEYPVDPENGLSFVFRPMPASELPLGLLQQLPGYVDQWQNAGLSIFVGAMEIARRKPERRFVFYTQAHSLPAVEGDQQLPAHARIVASCGDRRAEVSSEPKWRGEPRISLDATGIGFVPEEPTVMRESHYHCGSQGCEVRHHVTAWQPHAVPYVGLEHFVWNAVKGPMAKLLDGSVLKRAANNMKSGMYYPVLAEGQLLVTQNRIRYVEARVYSCPSCGQQGYEETTVVHQPGCALDPLRQKSDGRFVYFKIEEWALRPFYKTPDAEGLHQLIDEQLIDHHWFPRIVRRSAPNWTDFSHQDREDWYSHLSRDDGLIRLLLAHFVDISNLAPSDSQRMRLLRRTAQHRRAYARLLTDAEAHPAAPGGNDDVLWWTFIMGVVCVLNPWYFLLLHGLPPHLTSAPVLSRYEQILLICRAGDAAGWPGTVFRPRPPIHLWAKD